MSIYIIRFKVFCSTLYDYNKSVHLALFSRVFEHTVLLHAREESIYGKCKFQCMIRKQIAFSASYSLWGNIPHGCTGAGPLQQRRLFSTRRSFAALIWNSMFCRIHCEGQRNSHMYDWNTLTIGLKD